MNALSGLSRGWIGLAKNSIKPQRCTRWSLQDIQDLHGKAMKDPAASGGVSDPMLLNKIGCPHH
jgi:hypothetical protein